MAKNTRKKAKRVMKGPLSPSTTYLVRRAIAPGLTAMLVLIFLAGALPVLAELCPDDDLDSYADCTVPGCDPTGLQCGDCNDDDPYVNPGEIETCNHVDDDCDVQVDEDFTQVSSARKVTDPGAAAADLLGYSVAALGGDVDGDGVPDFMAAAPHDDTAQGADAGSVLVISGADLSRVCKATDPNGGANERLGYSVTGLGDITGDGTPDFAAGVYGDDTAQGADAGSVVVFSGADCSYLRKCTDTLGASADRLGWSVASIPDVSGDGSSEIIAGAPLANTIRGSDAGRVLVFSSVDCTVLHRSEDPAGEAADEMGTSVAGLGDVDGDDTADYAAGAPKDDATNNGQGSVSIFSGADGRFLFKLTDPTGATSAYLGTSVTRVDDVTGDGVPDVAAGAPLDDDPTWDAGSVSVFSGASGAWLRKCWDPQGAFNDYLGESVVGLPDITGDGKPEIVAGAPYRDTVRGVDSGRVVVFSAADCSVLHRFVDPQGQAGDQAGHSVAALEDLSGDGLPEVAVGVRLDHESDEQDTGSVVIFTRESDCDEDGAGPWGEDCDDEDVYRLPGETEVCDAKDNDCDDSVDEDNDGDGMDSCSGDCDETNPRIHLGAVEICNGIDDDCDGSADEGDDIDGDTHETPCDCDDNDEDVYPGATETCNHVDDDCDVEVDEEFTILNSARKVADPNGAANDLLGLAVTALRGDVNGDGTPDFVATAPHDDTAQGSDAGSVLVISGADLTRVCKATDPNGAAADRLGYSVTSLGDITGDGAPDFAAGVYGDNTAQGADAGSVVVFSGADCSYIRKCTDPEGAGSDRLGWSVASIPDVSGDGSSEIIAGAPLGDTSRGSDAGRVVVFSSVDCTVLQRSVDPLGWAADELGTAVVGLADVNADGVPDYAAGAPKDNTAQAGDAGSVVIFSGADGSFVRKLTDPGSSGGCSMGQSVTVLEDITGDGVPDIAAGAPLDDRQTANAGSVVIFSGADGTHLRTCTDTEGAYDERLGQAVAAAPDINGDRKAEIVAGVPYRDTYLGVDAGRVVVFSSADCTVLHRLVDPQGKAGDQAGQSVAVLEDLSGDGLPEVAAGANLDDEAGGQDSGSVVIFAWESDCDGDGYGPFGGDCVDDDYDSLGEPSEVRELRFVDKDTLSWMPPLDLGTGATVVYDTLRSEDPADFGDAAACVESNDGTDTQAADTTTPSPGAAFYYLVRADNPDCDPHEGTLGWTDIEERSGRSCSGN